MAKRSAAWRRSGLEAVADYAEDYISLFDLQFRHVFVNRAGARSVGMVPADFPGKTQAELGLPATLCVLWSGHLEAVVASGDSRTFEYSARLAQGWRVLETVLAPVKDSVGRVEAITSITRDITAWKADQSLRNAQNEAMRALAGGAALEAMLQLIVQLAEANLRRRRCCILLAEPGGTQLSLGCAGAVPPALLQAICAAPIGPDNACCGASAASRQPVQSADLAADPAWSRHRAVLPGQSLRVCASQPILTADGELLGTLAFYGSSARPPEPAELQVLRELAPTAAIAIRHCRTQESLLVTEQRFRALSENAANIVCVTDIHGVVEYVSPAVQSILGFAPESLVGRSAYERLHPDDVEPTKEIFRKLRDRVGAQVQARYRLQHHNGSWRTLETIAKSQIDHHGKFISVVSTRDVSEREEATLRLRDSEARLERALAASALGMWDWHFPSGQMHMDRHFSAIMGYTPDEVRSDLAWIKSFIHPDDMEEAASRVRNHLKGRSEYFECEYRARSKTGEWKWVLTRGRITEYAADGRAVRLTGTNKDVTERRQLQDQLQHQALHDPLTGLINRRGFELRLRQLLDSARLDGREHALCYIDLDQFKLINDNCGHIAGDELLRQLPQQLLKQVRTRDTLARLGGDEFGVLLADCKLDVAAQIAASLRDAVKSYRFAWQHRHFSVGASIGVVALTAKSAGVVSALSAADVACYVAKEQGPNRVHVSFPHDLAVSRRRGEMRWVARLRHALEDDRFCLHFQSIVPLDGSPACSHEILLRLLDDDGSLIMPGAFIPAAERYQLMSLLDGWVIEHLLRQLGKLLPQQPQLRQHRFAVNLSAESLRDPKRPGQIRQTAQICAVPAGMLCFEITETTAISNLATAMEFIHELKQHGHRFALDDFGSGMSSFSYLKHLPVDYLKIDGAFIRDMLGNGVDETIVRAINSVAQRMGIETVAECVESAAVFECLRGIGINHGQGYGLILPRPLEDLPLLFEAPAAVAVSR
jgi:diguanylate cyclase (GGDEF)-like protein/PAS domain S-box-containing protein